MLFATRIRFEAPLSNLEIEPLPTDEHKSYVHYFAIRSAKTKKKTELRGLSPRANYTDRATAACRPS
jgi:hypothetical protein